MLNVLYILEALRHNNCLLYTSDAADEEDSVDLGGRRIIKKKLGSCSISFLVHPGRSPGMILVCLSASRIYNTFSIFDP